MSNANVNRKRAAKTRNKLEMEIEDEPEVKKIMLKRRSLSKRQQKPPKYFEFYEIIKNVWHIYQKLEYFFISGIQNTGNYDFKKFVARL